MNPMFDFSSDPISTEQQLVLEHPIDKPALVDAGAGTGKTHTIVNRVAYLQESGLCRARDILLLTFARKAAAELRRRTLARLGPTIEPPHCSTFHGFASSLLLEHAYDLGVSPDSTVIEDVDARLEFRAAMDDVIHNPHADAQALPLRSARRDDLRAGLFAIAQNLKELDIEIDAFEQRALAAAASIESIPYREIHKRTGGGRVSTVTEASTADEALRREVVEAQARVRAAATIFRRYHERLARRFALTYADLLRLAR
ncbi:MAG TPA: UvrD-helicase domain-containing protein, partial [Candidatus Eremiobacteraceae bacterium]|nr:UvrD-helicase domain-containing protein [Candidatus Eremiobacteraceae bacterium]